MQKTNCKENYKSYLMRFKESRARRTKKTTALPFARKIDIQEKMQLEHKVIRDSVKTPH